MHIFRERGILTTRLLRIYTLFLNTTERDWRNVV